MTTLKGTAVQPNFDWVRKTYGEETWSAILERLTPEQRQQVAVINGGAAYDLKLVSAVLEALAELRMHGDHDAADEAFREMGAHIAKVSLTGLYSLFVRVATPEAIMKRIPTVVNTMFDGASAEMHSGGDGRSAQLVMRGLGDLAYAGPRLCGWAETALAMCGANATVTERGWMLGRVKSDELIFDARW